MADTSETHNPNCVRPDSISEDQLTTYLTILWWLEGFGSILIGSIGIVFNMTTIMVVLGSELAATFFNWLLVFLAVFDNFFLLSGILEAFRNHIGRSSALHDYLFVTFLFPFRSGIMCCSVYMTILLALERYHALAEPVQCHQRAHSMCKKHHSLKKSVSLHWKRLLKYIGPIIVLSTLLYIPKIMELKLVEETTCPNNRVNMTEIQCLHKYQVREAELRNNDAYILWYLNVTNVLATVVVPLTFLVYLNSNIFLKLKRHVLLHPSIRASQGQGELNEARTKAVQEKFERRERNMIQQTMMLFAIVILFLISHTPRIILNIEELVTLDNKNRAKKIGCVWLQLWTLMLVPVSHFLLQINSGVNLFIYCFFNSFFRKTLKSKLKKILCSFRCKRKDQSSIQITDQNYI